MKTIKTSNVILGVLGISLLIGIVLSINSVAKSGLSGKLIPIEDYKEITVDSFNKIEISGDIDITIINGETQKVRFFVKDEKDNNSSIIKNIDGILNISTKENQKADNKIFVNIETPNICSIVANNVSNLNMNNLELDTLLISSINTTINLDSINCYKLLFDIKDSTHISVSGSNIKMLTVNATNHTRTVLYNCMVKNFDGEIYDYSSFTTGKDIGRLKILADSTSRINKYIRNND